MRERVPAGLYSIRPRPACSPRGPEHPDRSAAALFPVFLRVFDKTLYRHPFACPLDSIRTEKTKLAFLVLTGIWIKLPQPMKAIVSPNGRTPQEFSTRISTYLGVAAIVKQSASDDLNVTIPSQRFSLLLGICYGLDDLLQQLLLSMVA